MTPNLTPNVTTPCALGITEETLSDLHDGLLDAAEARRLSEHTMACAACQERLRAFDALAWTIQAQRVPDLQARVWRDLQRRIAQDEGRRTMRRGPLFGGLAAVAAVVLVALFAVVLLHAHSSPGPLTGTPTASQSATPIASPTPIATNWRPSTLTANLCLDLFFQVAPSDPQTLYASTCSTGSTGHLARSRDGGVSWSLVAPLPGTGSGVVSVDPTVASDLLYVDSTATDAPVTLYRSTDGGTHWAQLPTVGQLPFAGLGWAGASAYLVLQRTSFDSAAEVYVSRDGAPFVRVYQGADLFGFKSSDYTVQLIGGHGATAYLVLSGTSQSTSGRAVILRTTDGGLHWVQVRLADSTGQSVSLDAVSPDGRTLLGSVEAIATSQTYLLSTDDGVSWRTLPTLPRSAYGGPVLTPDGTVIASAGPFPPTATDSADLYELLPNAPAWRLLTVPPNALQNALQLLHTVHWDLVQWDATGRPVALWWPSLRQDPQTNVGLVTLYMLAL